MDDQLRDDLVDRLAKAGWHMGGWTRNQDGTVEAKSRHVREFSGEPVRSIYGTDVDDAIRQELERLGEESSAGEPL